MLDRTVLFGLTKPGAKAACRMLAVGGAAFVCTALLVLPSYGQAQQENKTDMRGSHEDMRGSHAEGEAKGAGAAGVAGEAKSGTEVDHSKMDHSKMDHSGHADHGGHKMVMDAGGMVMNWNDDTPPRDCKNGVSEDVEFTVRAGRKYAKAGQSFGYDVNEWQVKPCARVKITLINEDKVRHQWMMHGLPRYLYDQSMFHIEAAGGQTRSGTFIVPSGDDTLLVHCDMAQHMEKGLKGQLKIGGGNGDLPSVPGISDARVHDRTDDQGAGWQMAILLGGLLIGVGIGGGLLGRNGK